MVVAGAIVLLGLAVIFHVFIRRQRHGETAAATWADDKIKPVLGIDASLEDLIPADEHRISRGDWVTRLASHVCRTRHTSRFNVLVFNKAVERYFVPEGVVEQFNVVYDSVNESPHVGKVTYEVTVFRKGHLVNLGDGGYINWCFEGNYERVGMGATFHEIGKP